MSGQDSVRHFGLLRDRQRVAYIPIAYMACLRKGNDQACDQAGPWQERPVSGLFGGGGAFDSARQACSSGAKWSCTRVYITGGAMLW